MELKNFKPNPNLGDEDASHNIAALIQEAKDAKSFLDNLEQDFNNAKNMVFYLISSKWLREWKLYTSYDNIINSLQPDETCFGQNYPSKINQDIVLSNDFIRKYPNKFDYRNVVLRDGLEGKIDYELLTEAAWMYFAKRYEHITVKRHAYMLPGIGKVVEVMLKKIQIVGVQKELFTQIQIGQAKGFRIASIQISKYISIIAFKTDLVKMLKTDKKGFSEMTEGCLRLFLLDPALDLGSFFKYVKRICEVSNGRSLIEIKGKYLEGNPFLTFGKADIAEEDIIFVDCRESMAERFMLFGGKAYPIWSCEYCNRVLELDITCGCNKVFYCTEECRLIDWKFHSYRCTKNR